MVGEKQTQLINLLPVINLFSDAFVHIVLSL